MRPRPWTTSNHPDLSNARQRMCRRLQRKARPCIGAGRQGSRSDRSGSTMRTSLLRDHPHQASWAISVQIAACVYCPPFSRTPGRYPFMQPGSTSLLSNGGARRSANLSSGRMRCWSTAIIASFARCKCAVGDYCPRLGHVIHNRRNLFPS